MRYAQYNYVGNELQLHSLRNRSLVHFQSSYMSYVDWSRNAKEVNAIFVFIIIDNYNSTSTLIFTTRITRYDTIFTAIIGTETLIVTPHSTRLIDRIGRMRRRAAFRIVVVSISLSGFISQYNSCISSLPTQVPPWNGVDESTSPTPHTSFIVTSS